MFEQAKTVHALDRGHCDWHSLYYCILILYCNCMCMYVRGIHLTQRVGKVYKSLNINTNSVDMLYT
jgi:hypothetical protein